MAAPTIVSTSPDTNQLGVIIYDDVTATFNLPVQFLRHNQSNEPLVFTLRDNTNTVVLQRKTDDSLPITCTYNDQTRTARLRVFVSLGALSPGSTYTASINGAVDLDGTPMTVAHTWSFQTRGDFPKSLSNSFSLGSTASETLSALKLVDNSFSLGSTASKVTIYASPPVVGYSVWFAADKLVGYSNTDPVTALTDSSTNENHATQGTPGNRGTFVASATNSLPAVAFDGSTTWYKTGSAVVGSVFVVCNHTDGGSTFTDYRRIFDASDLTGWSIFGLNAASDYNPVVFQRGISPFTFYVNGVNTLSAGTLSNYRVISGILDTPITFAVSVGSLGDGGSQFFKGNICEYVLYPTQLLSSDRVTVETYLMDKYAIS